MRAEALKAAQRGRAFAWRHHSGLAVLALALIMALLPFYLPNPFHLSLLNLIGLFVIAVLGLNLFIGYAGQISLGHAAFMGLGAYGSGLLTTVGPFPPWAAIFLVAGAVAVAALLLGLPTLRLHGHYLAMATLGFNYAVHLILVQWDAVTGGPSGLAGIPPLRLAGFPFHTDLHFYYLVWAVALAVFTLCLNLIRSGVGRGLAALAQDEVAAACLGVDVRRSKVKIFVLSAVFASLAGSLYAHYLGHITPDSFSIFKSLDLVIMVVVGGLGSVWGTLFGVSFVVILPHLLEPLENFFDILHGLILVLILVFLPQGLITGLRDEIRLRLARRELHRRASRESPGGLP